MNQLSVNGVKINGVEGKRVVGVKRKPHAFCCQNGIVGPTDPNFIESVKSLSGSIDSLSNVFKLFNNPMEFLKILAQVCIDLSFSITSIVSIVALSMFIFTGCKDKKPLQYVGLAVAAMYIISVIFSAFIKMV